MNKCLILILFVSATCLGQRGHKKAIKAIYEASIAHLFSGKGRNIIIDNITANDDIRSVSFAGIPHPEPERKMKLMNLDSSWLSVFGKADRYKTTLTQTNIPALRIPGFGIELIDPSSATRAGTIKKNADHQTYYVGSRVTLSGVILFRDKAIVSLTREGGHMDGEGVIYFLEKRKGKWKVVSLQNLWMA